MGADVEQATNQQLLPTEPLMADLHATILVAEDPTAQRLLRESQDRVRAMALVHEHLHQVSDLALVDTAQTLGLRLVAALVRQLKGQLHVDSGPGAALFITFPDSPEQKP